jgi:flagellar motor switch protein FliG
MDKSMSNMDQTKKAALLLLAVGEVRAADVLKTMGIQEVQVVSGAMTQLGEVSTDGVDDVLNEFITQIKEKNRLKVDSDSYIRTMLVNTLGEDQAEGMIDKILVKDNSKGIEQIKWMDTRSIVDLVGAEHPQIAAIILSLLNADQSAAVLALLDEAMRSDIIMRVARMDTIQPAAIKELDEVMKRQLSGEDGIKSPLVGGIDAVANILNYTDGRLVDEMMEEIMKNDALLGQEIEDKVFVFESLLSVDERGIQSILRDISTDQLLLAMRGASDELRNKIFNNMSKRAAEILWDDLEAAPPVKLSHVEQAQKEILKVARGLSDSGDIILGNDVDELV